MASHPATSSPVQLLFHSSEVSACIGEHKYRKRWEAFQGIFERINRGADFRKATDRMAKLGVKFINKDERIQTVVTNCNIAEDVQQFLEKPVQTSEELKNVIELFEEQLASQEREFKKQKNQFKDELAQKTQQHNQVTETLNVLKQSHEKIQQDIIALEESNDEVRTAEKRKELDQLQHQLQMQNDLSEQLKTVVSTQVEKLSRHEQQWSNFKTTKKDLIGMKQTSFGKQKEDSLIASQTLGLVSDNNTHFYQKLLGTKPFTWGVCGRIDGFRDGELIEIKNRKSHIYNPLPQYDVIQLQCYMQILDLTKATLIQSLATENNTYQTHETVVLRDNTYWNDFLLPELTIVAHAMSKFINDTLLQDKFLQTPDNKKSYVLTTLLNQVRKELDPSTGSKRKKPSKDSQPPTQPQSSKHPKSQVVTMDDFMEVLMTGGKSASSVQSDSSDVKDAVSPPLPSPPSTQMTSRICFFDVPGEIPVPVDDCSVPLVDYLPKDWATHLGDQTQKPYFQKLETFIDQDYKTFIVYPPRNQIFTAFHKCSWENVRVVILAQDPYINPGEAMGMAFSVPKGIKFPKSLKNIFEELQSDVKISSPLTGDLTPWASQGVLLLNTVMTVRSGKSDSHAGQGWELFTDFVIRKLSAEKPHLVFLLWGGKAQSKRGLIDGTKHTLLETSHPSPLSYARGFKGCKHFTKTNESLVTHGSAPIVWDLHEM